MTKCRAPSCEWPATQGFRTCSAHRYLDIAPQQLGQDPMTSWPVLIALCIILAAVGGRVACMLDGNVRRAEPVDTAEAR